MDVLKQLFREHPESKILTRVQDPSSHANNLSATKTSKTGARKSRVRKSIAAGAISNLPRFGLD